MTAMTRQQAQNIVLLLQHDPLYFRAFGPYWWPIKRALKAAGFNRGSAPHLGDYVDPASRGWFKGDAEAEVIAEAFRYQSEHTLDPHNDRHETPDGDPYTLRDEDFAP